MIKKITPPTTMLPPVTNVPNACTTSPASPFARISLVDAIDNTRRNIVPIRIIEGNAASSSGFWTYRDIIRRTIPKVIFSEIEKLITQFGISIMRINTKTITKSANAISDIGLLCCPSAAILTK